MSKESFRTVPETFWRLSGLPGPEAPGDVFETFSAFRARRARESSVRGGLVPNPNLGFEGVFLAKRIGQECICERSFYFVLEAWFGQEVFFETEKESQRRDRILSFFLHQRSRNFSTFGAISFLTQETLEKKE